MSSRVSATLVVVAVVISVIGAAHAQGAQSFASCGGRNFCQRWMCRQKNNRLCNIAMAVDPSLTGSNCASAAGSDAFEAAKTQCDTFQGPSSLVDTCTVTASSSSNVLVTPGLLYDETTCTNPNPDDDTYVPFQLRKSDGPQEHKETVYVEDRALHNITVQQYANASEAIRQGCTGTVPNAGPDYQRFTCICTSSVTDVTCQQEIVDQLYRNSTFYQDLAAQEFVKAAAPLLVSMQAVVNGVVVTTETAPSIAQSNQQLSGSNSIFANNTVYTEPPTPPLPPPPVPSPVPGRRRLRERNLMNRMMQASTTGAQVAHLG